MNYDILSCISCSCLLNPNFWMMRHVLINPTYPIHRDVNSCLLKGYLFMSIKPFLGIYVIHKGCFFMSTKPYLSYS